MTRKSTAVRPPSSYGVKHPLDLLTADEIAAAKQILIEAGHITESTRVPRLVPIEPAKDIVAAHVEMPTTSSARSRSRCWTSRPGPPPSST